MRVRAFAFAGMLFSALAAVTGIASCGNGTSATGGGASSTTPEAAIGRLVQFGTLEQLNRGEFDGPTTVQQIAQGGDLGLGTFDALDGEMMVLDGIVYRFTSDGVLRVADPTANAPFAAVTKFSATSTSTSDAGLADYTALKASLDGLLPDQQQMIAFRLHGTMASIRTRAPQKQSKPYPPFDQAITTQVEFTYTNIQGTLVGFRLPAYLGTTNATGYHLHFVSDDHTVGGHVLDVSPAAGLTIDSDLLGELFLEVAAPDAGAADGGGTDGGGRTDSGADGGGDAGGDAASDASTDATTDAADGGTQDGGEGDAATDAQSTD